MKIDHNTVLGLEAWAMLLLHAGWDYAADEIFSAIEERQRQPSEKSGDWIEAVAPGDLARDMLNGH